MENISKEPSSIFSGQQQPLPNATASLVLGIISIVGCCCYGVLGYVFAIIALVLASKDTRLYRANPSAYTVSSYNNSKAGRICAIISLVLSSLYVICIIAFISMLGWATVSNPQALQEALRNMQH